MPNPAWRKVFQQLRKSALLSDGASLSDAQLLDCFLTDRDEDAFTALVRRHGPMVFGVCRRLLPTWQDAEDAFQATFLVLARKASAIQPRRQVGNWLYGVAYRTALEAKTILAKRRAKERPLQDVAQPEPADESWRELRPILDGELNRLPDKYRIVIVCCDLQGKTRREAAGQLGWPEGTVAARLARGRRLLRARLIRRGLTLSVTSLPSLLSRKGASACVSKALEVCTVKAAAVAAADTSMATGLVSTHVAVLTQGVLKSMFYTKLKFAAGFLIVLGVIGFGTGVRMYAGGARPVASVPFISEEIPHDSPAEGVKPLLDVSEADQTKAVEEIEEQRAANVAEEGRESKKKVEKKKQGHEEDEDDDEDGRKVKKADKKKRDHEDDDEDDDRGRESKKKAGAKKREHRDDEDDDRESKKKAGARKREHEDAKGKGRESKKASRKKREHEEEDDRREHARKKTSAKKREHEDDDDRRESKSKAKKKSGRHEDDDDHRESMKKDGKKKSRRENDGDDDRESKKKGKKAKRSHEDDDDDHVRKDKRKVEEKNRRHEEEDDHDRRESVKKGGKKKHEHEDDEDEGREAKKKRRHKDE